MKKDEIIKNIEGLKMAARVIFLLLAFITIANAQVTPINNPVPMHVGNKYQFLHEYVEPNDFITQYSLKEYEITGDTVIDGNVYFKYERIYTPKGGSDWFRYDSLNRHLLIRGADTDYVHMDFNAEDGDSIKVYMRDGSFEWAKCERGSITKFGKNRQYSGYYYWKGSIAGPTEYNYHFVEGLGIVKNCISALIYDEYNIHQNMQENFAPQISFTPITETNFDYFSIKADINHVYTRIYTHEVFANSEVNFINEAVLEYFYEYSGEITGRDSATGERRPWTREYRFTTPLDTTLLKNGYVFKYRIKATDKTLMPNISVSPYQTLTWNPEPVSDRNYFPIQPGNSWLFKVEKSDRYHQLEDIYLETVTATDTTTFSGVKYYYLDKWKNWFGYDAETKKVAIKYVNDALPWAAFQKYEHELFESYNFRTGKFELAAYHKKTMDVFGEAKEVSGFRGILESHPQSYYLAEDIGPVEFMYTTDNGWGGVHYYEGELVQALIRGKDSVYYYPCKAVPEIEHAAINRDQSFISVTADVKHDAGALLIGDVYMSVEYRKEGSGTVEKTIVPDFDENNSGATWKTAIFNDTLNTTIIAEGYDYLLRIFATDKGILQGQAVYPEDGWYSVIGDSVTGVKDEPEQVKEYSLSQNYPNPFNPSTVINYSLPVDSKVKITIYDMLGREVAEPVNGVKAPGVYSLRFDGSGLPSGVYIYAVTASGTNGQKYRQVRKMLMVK